MITRDWEDILFNDLKENSHLYEDCMFKVWERPQVVEDAPLFWKIVDSKGGNRAVCMSSNHLHPTSIKKAVSRLNLAFDLLAPEDKKHVLLPDHWGEINGISYAVYPFCQSLSNSRLGWWFQKRRLQTSVFNWLISVLKQSLSQPKIMDMVFQNALKALIDCNELHSKIRRDALVAMKRLESQQWMPKHTLSHNDLWKGNILTRDEIFVLIDWGSSQVQGIPIYDLTRFSMSMGVSSSRFRKELVGHCNILHCSLEDSMGYLLAALGDILMNLDQFPMDKYLELTQECHRKLLSAVN